MHTRRMDQLDKWGGHTWSSMNHGLSLDVYQKFRRLAKNDPK